MIFFRPMSIGHQPRTAPGPHPDKYCRHCLQQRRRHAHRSHHSAGSGGDVSRHLVQRQPVDSLRAERVGFIFGTVPDDAVRRIGEWPMVEHAAQSSAVRDRVQLRSSNYDLLGVTLSMPGIDKATWLSGNRNEFANFELRSRAWPTRRRVPQRQSRQPRSDRTRKLRLSWGW